jgi:hypothetical protein
MDMNKKTLKLLYQSFDEDLDEKEQKLLEEALKKSEELRREKEQILAQRQAVSQSAVRSFRPFFAEGVMRRINTLEKKENALENFYDSLKAMFWRFATIGAVGLIALIIYNLIAGNSLPLEEAFFISDLTFEEILQMPLF